MNKKIGYHGIINVYKESGFTSHDVVAKMRGICRQKKIGHTGTLDPAAVGVLPVCLGAATVLSDLLTDKTKEYEATLHLGITTDTQDMTGKILESKMVDLEEDRVRTAIESFVGDYDQVPPMYSAIKIDGKKLVDLARSGKEVERVARRVYIHEIKILSMDLPTVRMRVQCSKGTYIRTLCHDIGQSLEVGGCMEDLIRTKVDRFSVEDALTLGEIEALMPDRICEKIIGVEDYFSEMACIHTLPAYNTYLSNGNKLQIVHIKERIKFCDGQMYRTYTADGRFLAIYRYLEKDNVLKPYRMFLGEYT